MWRNALKALHLLMHLLMAIVHLWMIHGLPIENPWIVLGAAADVMKSRSTFTDTVGGFRLAWGAGGGAGA